MAPEVTSGSRIERAIRGAILAAIFLACCYAAYGVGRWLALVRNAPPTVDAQFSDAANLDPLAAALPLGGQWAFDDLDWNLKSQFVKRTTLDAEFEKIGNSPIAKLDPQLPATDPEMIEMLTALQIQPVERSGDLVYCVNRPDLRAELVTRKSGERLTTVAFAMAYPQSGDTWQLYVFTPKQTTDDAAPAAPHLLPLPADARRSGGRFADDGRVLMEFVSLAATADDLVRDWTADGWVVHESGMAQPGDFSYLAIRGDETIYAWSDDPADAMKHLMLVRTPAGADTGP
ncbi:MAG: hypothetical protein AB7G28_25260 [Pirellulales bacterium]